MVTIKLKGGFKEISLNQEKEVKDNMKKFEIGAKIIVGLGKNFGNARIIATYEGKHEEKKDSSVIKPLEVTYIKDSYKFIVNTILKTRLIISDSQILSKY